MKAKKRMPSVKKPILEIKSNKVYEKNLRALSNTYPDVYRMVAGAGSDNPYEVRATEKGMPNLWLKDLRRYYYDLRDPAGDAARQVEALGERA